MVAAAFAYTARVWADPSRLTIGVIGDPDLYIWFLGWFSHAAAHLVNPLLTDHMNHPSGVNLMWNTSDPLQGLLAAPATAWLGPILTYNLLFVASFALTGWAAEVAARHFGLSRAAALLTGLLYAFSPYMLAQGRAHLSTVFMLFAPLLAIVIDEAVCRQRGRPLRIGLAAGTLAGLEMLVLEEYVATAVILCAVTLGVLAVATRRWEPRRLMWLARAVAWSLVPFLLIAGLPLAVQFLGPQQPRLGSVYHSTDRFVIDLLSVVFPAEIQAVQPAFARPVALAVTGDLYENSGYIGLPLLGVVAFAAARWWSDLRVRTITLTTAAVLALSMGPTLHAGGHDTFPMPWALVQRLPLMSNALPARLSLYTDLGLALLAGFFADRLIVHGSGRARLGAVAATALVVLAWLPSPSPVFRQEVPPFFTTAAVTAIAPDSVVLVAPFAVEGVEQPMVWQSEARMRFRMPEGYFLSADAAGRPRVGVEPSTLSDYMTAVEAGTAGPLTPALRAQMEADMAARDVSAVIVGPMNHRPQMVALFTALLGSPPEESGGVCIWRSVPADLS